jgi:hypothetical protein
VGKTSAAAETLIDFGDDIDPLRQIFATNAEEEISSGMPDILKAEFVLQGAQ